MTIFTPPKRKISLASMVLGTLLMTSLSAGNANASLLSFANCKIFQCRKDTCANPKTLIDCAEKCDYSSIKNCVSQNCSKLDSADKKSLVSALQLQLSAKEKEHTTLEEQMKTEKSQSKVKSLNKEQDKLIKEINMLSQQIEQCSPASTSNAPSTSSADTSPVSEEAKTDSPAASHENASSSAGRPLNLAEEAVEAAKKRGNFKKIGSPDTPPGEKVTPRPDPRLERASPTKEPQHVTQQAAAKGSAEDLKGQLKPFDFTMLGSLSKGKTPDQILDIIKEKPGLFTEKEKVVQYLEKLKEEEGATPPAHEEKGAAEGEEVAHTPPPAAHIPPPPSDLLSPPNYAPPPLPSTSGEATPPKRGVGTAFLTPPRPLVLPPSQPSAPQNVKER